jgi:hypothetical protein
METASLRHGRIGDGRNLHDPRKRLKWLEQQRCLYGDDAEALTDEGRASLAVLDKRIAETRALLPAEARAQT